MIKSFFHYICVLIAGALWASFLVGAVYLIILSIYHVTPQTFFHGLARFWNQGNVLRGRDLIVLAMVILSLPLCFYGWYKLYHFKYIKLLTVPLNKILNGKYDNYVAPDVNIKNLKIEEKKTLDQFIQERLDIEKKKRNTENNADFRREIIEKIQGTENL